MTASSQAYGNRSKSSQRMHKPYRRAPPTKPLGRDDQPSPGALSRARHLMVRRQDSLSSPIISWNRCVFDRAKPWIRRRILLSAICSAIYRFEDEPRASDAAASVEAQKNPRGGSRRAQFHLLPFRHYSISVTVSSKIKRRGGVIWKNPIPRHKVMQSLRIARRSCPQGKPDLTST